MVEVELPPAGPVSHMDTSSHPKYCTSDPVP